MHGQQASGAQHSLTASPHDFDRCAAPCCGLPAYTELWLCLLLLLWPSQLSALAQRSALVWPSVLVQSVFVWQRKKCSLGINGARFTSKCLGIIRPVTASSNYRKQSGNLLKVLPLMTYLPISTCCWRPKQLFACRGRLDEFTVEEDLELGDLSHVTVGHDSAGKSPSWHLESLVVTHKPSGRQWSFACGLWFDLHQSDGRAEHDLYPSR